MWHVRGRRDTHIGAREGKGPLVRPRHIYRDIIKMDLNEMGWESVNVIGSG